ncbi:hypothetical protein ACE8EZ_19840 [Pantoea deleyi]
MTTHFFRLSRVSGSVDAGAARTVNEQIGISLNSINIISLIKMTNILPFCTVSSAIKKKLNLVTAMK